MFEKSYGPFTQTEGGLGMETGLAQQETMGQIPVPVSVQFELYSINV